MSLGGRVLHAPGLSWLRRRIALSRSFRCTPGSPVVLLGFDLALTPGGIEKILIRRTHCRPEDEPGFDEMVTFIAARLTAAGYHGHAEALLDGTASSVEEELPW